MKNCKYVITDELGLHARPAGLIVKEAKNFESNITIICGEKKSSAKGLMGIMAMGVKTGMEVELVAEGPDEDAAISAMEEFLKNNL